MYRVWGQVLRINILLQQWYVYLRQYYTNTTILLLNLYYYVWIKGKTASYSKEMVSHQRGKGLPYYAINWRKNCFFRPGVKLDKEISMWNKVSIHLSWSPDMAQLKINNDKFWTRQIKLTKTFRNSEKLYGMLSNSERNGWRPLINWN